jgi:ABC-2 type transport system permease protein
VSLGYFHPMVMASLIASVISLATMVTAEMESGFMDLILSRPLARHWLITRSIIVGVLAAAAPLAMMLIGTTLGLTFLAPKQLTGEVLRLVLALSGNLGLLMLCWCGVALAFGSCTRRRGAAGWGAGLIALGTFLLDYVARAWKPLESLSWISPFRYYSAFDLLMGKSLPMTNVLVLVGIACAGFALAYFFFQKRDIPH